jgi:hypothetical protein
LKKNIGDFEMKKLILLTVMLAVFTLLQGCAIVYLDERHSDTITEREYGVLGFIPLYRSKTVNTKNELAK